MHVRRNQAVAPADIAPVHPDLRFPQDSLNLEEDAVAGPRSWDVNLAPIPSGANVTELRLQPCERGKRQIRLHLQRRSNTCIGQRARKPDRMPGGVVCRGGRLQTNLPFAGQVKGRRHGDQGESQQQKRTEQLEDIHGGCFRD